MGYSSSYDLMVFEPDAAAKEYDAFLAWFEEQMECDEGHAYNDSRETSERLRAWYRDMLLVFPSGADEFEENSPGEYEEDCYSGYSIGRQFVYVIFVPRMAESARRTAFDLAAKHGLGLFEPSSEGAELWRPEAGKLVLVHRQQAQVQEEPSWWQRLTGTAKVARLPRPRLPDWMS
jgi:hypothetical protein